MIATASPMHMVLRIFAAEPPVASAHPGVHALQVWRGGATNRETRGMHESPPRWLALADVDAGAAGAADIFPSDALFSWRLEQRLPGRAPSPEAGGLILVSMDVRPEQEEEFNDWYDTEHIPLLSAVPGVIAARRFSALSGSPKYVALYHVEDISCYGIRSWTRANETPWILRMRRFQENRTYFMFNARVP
jgi:hypothetical protein